MGSVGPQRAGFYSKWHKPGQSFSALKRLCGVFVVLGLVVFSLVSLSSATTTATTTATATLTPTPALVSKQQQLDALEEEEERHQFQLQLGEDEAEEVELLDGNEEGEDDEQLEVQDDHPPPPPPPSTQEEGEKATEGVEEEEGPSEPRLDTLPVVNGVFGNAQLLGGTYDSTTGLVELQAQIHLPEVPIIQHYDSTQNYWPLHAILRERGWAFATQALPGRVSLYISRGQVPPRMKEGQQMLNSMGVSGCIGGSKSLQLECRRRIATLHGCEYESLGIQPSQFNMLKPEDCARLAGVSEPKAYLSKPTYTFHGSGIKIHQNTAAAQLSKQYCGFPTIIMDYIAKPATMLGGFKFDFRTYLLVGSLKPQLVFYHDGFVRKSDRKFDLNAKDLNVHITNKVSQSKDEHFFNFDTLGKELHTELGLPLDHLSRVVVPKAKKISRFLFQSTLIQQKPPRHVAGRFHLFGIDWMLDSQGELHLLEGNGYPLVTHYPTELGLTPRIWEEMTDLILGLQTTPKEFLVNTSRPLTVQSSYSFGRWHLVFNELEEEFEKARGNAYNCCKAFGVDPTTTAN